MAAWRDRRQAGQRSANLRSANLRSANLAPPTSAPPTSAPPTSLAFSIVPETGDFEAWKRLRDGVIAKLLVPSRAERVSTPTGRKCRASYVKVLALFPAETKAASCIHDASVVYRVGCIVRADTFDDDIRVECTHGIHFFVTRKEAEEYQ